MRAKRIIGLLGFLLVAGSAIALGGPSAAIAAGDYYTGPNPAYDINSYNFYCTGGGTACIPSGSYALDCAQATVACPGLNYADVEAFGPTNGSTNSTPDELVLFCAQDTSASTPGYNFGWLDVASPAGQADYPNGSFGYGPYRNGDPGTIGGKATLLQANPASDTGKWYNTSQVSSINASAFDPDQSLAYELYERTSDDAPNFPGTGSVTGTQNTNNHGDTLNAGQFRITIHGYLYHYSPTNPYFYWGTISCVAGGPHASDIANAGLEQSDGGPSFSNAEGELEHYVGDNPFFISPPIPLG